MREHAETLLLGFPSLGGIMWCQSCRVYWASTSFWSLWIRSGNLFGRQWTHCLSTWFTLLQALFIYLI